MPEMYQVKNLYDKQDYAAIVALYDSQETHADWSAWDYFYLLHAYNRLKRYQACLDAYKQSMKAYPDFKRSGPPAAYALYSLCFKEADTARVDIHQMEKQLEFIIHQEEDHASSYSRVWPAMKVLLVAVEKQVTPYPHNALIKVLDMVRPSQLSQWEVQRKVEEKEIRLASPMEEWYAKKSDALYRAHQYDACVACVDEALVAVRQFHSNNDVWIPRRKALSLVNLGKVKEGRTLLLSLTGKLKNEWLYRDLFLLEADHGDPQQAIKYGCICASMGGEDQKMIRFSNQFATFLMQQGKDEMAMLERQLAINVATAHGDPVKPLEENWSPSEKIAAMTTQQLIKKLRPMWRDVMDQDKEFFEGTIANVNTERKLGNIQGPDGQKRFFKFNACRIKKDELQVGCRVRFALEDRYDQKKKRWDKNAVDITVIK